MKQILKNFVNEESFEINNQLMITKEGPTRRDPIEEYKDARFSQKLPKEQSQQEFLILDYFQNSPKSFPNIWATLQ